MEQSSDAVMRSGRAALAPHLDARAHDVARVVGDRVARVGCSRTGNEPLHSCGLAGGYAGLALFAAALDAAFPDAGWDRVAHRQMISATSDAAALGRLGPSLHEGWGGLVLTAHVLARGGRRYREFLNRAEVELVAGTTTLIADLEAAPVPLSPPLVDVISGLSGVVAVLLLRRDRPKISDALRAALQALVRLADRTGDIPRASSPGGWGAPLIHGVGGPIFNLGLAHGLPGPIAALSIAYAEDVRVGDHRAAIESLVGLVLDACDEDAWGPTWPHAVPVDYSVRPRHGRMAWCYGPPGCARALWLAGAALERAEWKALAARAIAAALGRPAELRGLPAATFCHGLSGLLQIAIRFYADTRDEELRGLAVSLLEQILVTFDADASFGYQGLDRSNRWRDDPGLLNGAAGVGLVLLSASAGGPEWDRAMLLR